MPEAGASFNNSAEIRDLQHTFCLRRVRKTAGASVTNTGTNLQNVVLGSDGGPNRQNILFLPVDSAESKCIKLLPAGLKHSNQESPQAREEHKYLL